MFGGRGKAAEADHSLPPGTEIINMRTNTLTSVKRLQYGAETKDLTQCHSDNASVPRLGGTQFGSRQRTGYRQSYTHYFPQVQVNALIIPYNNL